MTTDPLTAPELARQLGVDPSYLRQLIREHDLVPGHPRQARYRLDDGDVERISRHPAVRMAAAGRRERQAATKDST